MSTRRIAKVGQAIREVVSTAVLTEIRDPRVRDVTVISVDVAADMRSAKVHVSVMGESQQQALSMQGLRSARGFLQGRIAEQLDLRYTPVLTFILDQGVKKSIATSRLLRQLEDERAAGKAPLIAGPATDRNSESSDVINQSAE